MIAQQSAIVARGRKRYLHLLADETLMAPEEDIVSAKACITKVRPTFARDDGVATPALAELRHEVAFEIMRSVAGHVFPKGRPLLAWSIHRPCGGSGSPCREVRASGAGSQSFKLPVVPIRRYNPILRPPRTLVKNG